MIGRASRSFEAALGGGTPLVKAGAEAEWLKELNRRAQIVERRPLVVGMATHCRKDIAQFGWLIGPRMITDTDGSIVFRHVPSRHTLSAIISVPAWWQQARIEIRTNWLNENGRIDRNASENDESVVAFNMRLPGDLDVITERLQRKKKRSGPVVFSHLMPAVLLQADTKASVLIPGRNLWRSTVVTIGSNRSNRISVLPNMEGIIAEFPKIMRPPDWNESKNPTYRGNSLRMFVWTSEGVVEIEYQDVRIEMHAPSSEQPETGEERN